MSPRTPLEILTEFVSARGKYPRTALFALKAEALRLLPGNRLGICHHHRLPQIETVDILYSPKRERAWYRGLMRCGMGWVCPVCAQRLSEIRREMLTTALNNSREKYLPLMVTYTAQHYKGQPLKSLLEGMNAAYRYMRQQRLWRVYKEEYDLRGETRALEITYGDNGWHPHFHVLLWIKIEYLKYLKDEHGNYDIKRMCEGMETAFTPMWIEALEKYQLTALAGPGLHVQSSWDLISDYLSKSGTVLPADTSKWGIAEEMTKGQLKKARADGKTPWEILLESYAGFPGAGDLFVEYEQATRGKSALRWSPGLAAELGVSADEMKELAKEQVSDDEVLLASLTIQQWQEIIFGDAIGALLDRAGRGEKEGLDKLLGKVHQYAVEHALYLPD
jgi:Replication protein